MNHLHKQRGATLIEVLVAVLILSVGLLGMAGLQLTSLKGNQSAYQRSQATLLAYDVSERMRTNLVAAKSGNYNQEDPLHTDCSEYDKAAGTLAQTDMGQWLASLSCVLGSEAAGSIKKDGDFFIITIEWQDIRGEIQGETAKSSQIQSFSYRTQL